MDEAKELLQTAVDIIEEELLPNGGALVLNVGRLNNFLIDSKKVLDE